jgi:hypothetical protein
VITSSVGLVSVAGVAAKVSADLILPHHRWKLRAAVAGGGGQEARAQLTGRCVLLDSRVPCRAPQQPCSATTSSLATRSRTSSTSAHHDGLWRLQRALLKSGSCALRMSSHRRCSLPPPTWSERKGRFGGGPRTPQICRLEMRSSKINAIL